MPEIEEYLGRHEAAEFLQISTRTLDRYVQSKKINLKRQKGKLLFSKPELERLRREREIHTPQFIMENGISALPESSEERKYQILWEKAQEELQTKERLLLDLHHRMGFLEAELKNSVPLLESRTSIETFEKDRAELEKKMEILRKNLVRARISRLILLFLLFLTLTGLLFASLLRFFSS